MWKIIRIAGQGRNKNTYCSYIIENDEHKHKLKTIEGTKLFDLLKSTTIIAVGSDKDNVYVDGIYLNNELLFISNPRKM